MGDSFFIAGIAILLISLIFLSGGALRFIEHATKNKSVPYGWIGVFFVALMFFFANKCSALGVEMFVGVDDTKTQSPQCENEWPEWSDRATSNIGFTVWVSEGQYISTAVQQSHASCVYNQDRNIYDATGFYFYGHVTDRIDIFYGKDRFHDLGEWVAIYGVRATLFTSGDGRGSFSLKYTQRDMTSREYEAEYNYKGYGLELRLRGDFFK